MDSFDFPIVVTPQPKCLPPKPAAKSSGGTFRWLAAIVVVLAIGGAILPKAEHIPATKPATQQPIKHPVRELTLGERIEKKERERIDQENLDFLSSLGYGR